MTPVSGPVSLCLSYKLVSHKSTPKSPSSASVPYTAGVIQTDGDRALYKIDPEIEIFHHQLPGVPLTAITVGWPSWPTAFSEALIDSRSG